ncbi:hypothetical protein NLJ89_g11907 [Agrocybe chaxingu]|uniref:Uncharacterized protein n=1 Tax=Agrocybe chaxingu TaxID=84603 RepID=A0A9W8MNZ4_9AGAR|nr:hypothetical protein NLJ89_g11907 [Agrocybe chaxingu]
MRSQVSKAACHIHALSVRDSRNAQVLRKVVQNGKRDRKILDEMAQKMPIIEQQQQELYRLYQQLQQTPPSVPPTMIKGPRLSEELGCSDFQSQGIFAPPQWSAIHQELFASGYRSSYETPTRPSEGRRPPPIANSSSSLRYAVTPSSRVSPHPLSEENYGPEAEGPSSRPASLRAAYNDSLAGELMKEQLTPEHSYTPPSSPRKVSPVQRKGEFSASEGRIMSAISNNTSSTSLAVADPEDVFGSADANRPRTNVQPPLAGSGESPPRLPTLASQSFSGHNPEERGTPLPIGLSITNEDDPFAPKKSPRLITDLVPSFASPGEGATEGSAARQEVSDRMLPPLPTAPLPALPRQVGEAAVPCDCSKEAVCEGLEGSSGGESSFG